MLDENRNIPRWGIFLVDVLISLFSIILAYLLRFNFTIPAEEYEYFLIALPLVVTLRAITFAVFKTFAGIVRYTTSQDAQRIFLTVMVGTLILCFANFVNHNFNEIYVVPFSIIIIEFVMTIFLMTAFRLFIKSLYQRLVMNTKEKSNVIIYGAKEAGLTTKKTLERDRGMKYKVVAFIDDAPNLKHKKLDGKTIYPTDELVRILDENEVDLFIISGIDLPSSHKQQIVDLCLKHNVKVLNVPPMNKWINGELSFKQIRKIKIEELLEREPIKLDIGIIKEQINNKTILITGAAGSIGSELVRQIIRFEPAKVVLLDKAETPLYELELELIEQLRFKHFEVVIGDVRNQTRMENVFRHYQPDWVYHAAAYKHVPMMENNPSEAVLTNIMGTQVVADLAVKYKTQKFVLVSTDKAVNPTNVMGASKRIAEIYVQTLDGYLETNQAEHTKFITTRFGNVLGSNGSVIPLFRKQIETGGPITVTHPEVTRYFMTIPEVSQLVIEAGAIGNGGEIFIFDMGQSVKIVDLAKKMVKLSGFELGKDIQITFTGLRPGEKLYEELLNNQENTLPTHHPKIMIAKVREYEMDNVAQDIKELIDLFEEQDNFKIVHKMKKIIPEYTSNNSVFESLDDQQIPADQPVDEAK